MKANEQQAGMRSPQAKKAEGGPMLGPAPASGAPEVGEAAAYELSESDLAALIDFFRLLDKWDREGEQNEKTL